MRLSLLPREPWFFDAIQRLTRQVHHGGELLVALLSSHPLRAELVDEIHHVEIDCDAIAQEINHKLATTLVTPIDREDIFDLVIALNKVMDAIHDAAEFVPVHRIEHVREDAVALAQIIVRQTEQLVLAAGIFRR